MTWIALHLPLLSLEAFAATLPSSQALQPIALVDAHRIASVNAAASALGVRAGQKRATALALAPDILLGQADPQRDAQALQALAHAALAFTPAVSIQPRAEAGPDTVLLEVSTTLRYFGGLEKLLQRLLRAVEPLGHRVQVAVAPTPLGAALLARVHRRIRCDDPVALREALSAAPLWLLGPGQAHREAFEGMGLNTLSDLRRLPRAGLARRFGQALLDEIDAAFGDRPDPRRPIELPTRFEARLELFARADTSEQVLHGASVLLGRFVAWLSARHAMARSFTVVMHHEPRWRHDAQAPARTALELALAEPSRDAKHLLGLMRERLVQLQLPAPTLELTLCSGEVVQQPAPNGELFPTPASEHEGLVRLIERLQARLGPQQVTRLRRVHDHRPERASEEVPVDPSAPRRGNAQARQAVSSEEAPGARAVQPVWLLWPPEPLAEVDLRPLLDGRPLQLLSGPERVESGWWDQGLVQRDYFIAQAQDQALVWIFRTRLPAQEEGGGWFLQGRFA